MKIARLVFALAVLALPLNAQAQLYPLFGPVDGILKGSAATPQTSAAAAADVTTLFGCTTAGQFLNQAGGCTVPAGVTPSGSANQVYATPNGSTGSASLRALVAADVPPINLGSTANGGVSSATILLGTNGGTSNGFFSVTGPTTALRTFTFPNASATVLTTNAAVTVAQGGTGLATLTANGVLLGEGTSNISSLVMGADTVLRGTASADPVAAAVNNCGDATHALSYSTSTHAFGCQNITAGGTGTVTSVAAGTGLTASPSPIVGSGTMSLDLTAANTWTGRQTFTGGAGSQGYVTGTAGVSALFEFAGNGQTAGTASLAVGQDTTGAGILFQRANSALSLWTNATQRILIAAAGAVSINAPTSSDALTVTAVANNNALALVAPNTANQSFGAFFKAGSSASDYALLVRNAANTGMFQIRGDGAILGGSSGAVDMTPSSGTYTATFNGFSGSITRTGTYYKIGNTFCTSIGSGTGTSNSTSFTITGIPAAGTPATQVGSGVMELEDNGTLKFAYWRIPSGGTTITFSNGVNGAVFTASGTKGIDDNFTACWITN